MEKRGEVTKARGRGRQWEEDGEDMEVRETGMHEKIAQKRNRFGFWGCLLGLPPCHTPLVIHF